MKPRPPLPAGPFLVVGLARSGLAALTLLRSRGEEAIGVDSCRQREPGPVREALQVQFPREHFATLTQQRQAHPLRAARHETAAAGVEKRNAVDASRCVEADIEVAELRSVLGRRRPPRCLTKRTGRHA